MLMFLMSQLYLFIQEIAFRIQTFIFNKLFLQLIALLMAFKIKVNLKIYL